MLLPKPGGKRGFIPAMSEHGLSWLAGKLGPAERKAMREIAQAGDLAEVNGKTYIVAPVSPKTIDALAAFEAEGEDRESADLCDEPGQDKEESLGGNSGGYHVADCELDRVDDEPNGDNEPDHDNEPSIC